MQTTRRTLLKAAASITLVGLGSKTASAQGGTFNQKVATNVEKAKEKNKKGLNVTVTHEKGVASKIAPVMKKAAP